MAILCAFYFEENIYHFFLEEGEKVTLGSGKKDTVIIEALAEKQVSVQFKKGKGIFVSSKSPYFFGNQQILLDAVIMINRNHRMYLYAGEYRGQSPELVALPYHCAVKIGRSVFSDVRINHPCVSRNHMIIRSEAGIIRVEDTGSTNGTYVNGRRINQTRLHSGDVISTMNLRILLINGVLYFDNIGEALSISEHIHDKNTYDVKMRTNDGRPPRFQRSPRMQEQLPRDGITLAPPPSKPAAYEKHGGGLGMLLSSGVMLASSMMMGAASPAFLAARAASLVSPAVSMGSMSKGNKTRKKKTEEYEEMRRERYGQYVEEQKARISTVANEQRDILTRENPSPEDCAAIVSHVKRNLWERSCEDRDFLDVRLGMGYEPLCVPVKSFVNEGSFRMEMDDIRQMAEDIIEETRIVDYVPARLKMSRYSTIGIIGDRKRVINEVKNLLVNLCTLHFYRDVKIVGIFDETEKEEWESLRWLPHVWDDSQQSRFLAFKKSEAHNLCERMNEMIKSRIQETPDSSYMAPERKLPHYIFVLGSKKLLQDELITSNLLVNRPELGVTCLFLYDRMHELPLECRYIVDMDHNPEPAAYERDKYNLRAMFTTDKNITGRDFDTFARNMSSIRLDNMAEKASVPDSITFLEGFCAKRVEQLDVQNRWMRNRAYISLAAPIGMMEGNEPFCLDIREEWHGSHGLVAGTTGSGKSELLITWILSMAVNYNPCDVAFVIIDYKGGGMAQALKGLPHLAGTITNIGSGIERSLVSLKSEIQRRYQLFDKYSAICEKRISHIDQYQRLYYEGKIKEPLPRLILVADEFAELKKEKPEFMKEIASIARVGRSIGFHEVLATQKPSGVVDDQVWSNSRFRLCLKVSSVADSREMLKKPDAAYIKRTGRAYIQVGNDEIYENFQSYWSGAPYVETSDGQNTEKPDSRVRVVYLDGTREKIIEEQKTVKKTDLDEAAAVIRHLNEVADRMKIPKMQGPLLKELPEEVLLSAVGHKHGFDGSSWEKTTDWLSVPVGIYDCPEMQRQGTQYVNFHESGHLGIYGSPSSGKTTLLKTILLSIGLNYSPKEVQIYGFDCGGWGTGSFSDMPHVGGIALDCEQEKVEKLAGMIQEELARRKKLFIRHRVGSLYAYRTSVSTDIPAWIIFADNFPALFELYPDMENLLITLSGQGAAYGIYLVFTSNSATGIRYKVQQNIKNAITFELTDKGDYANLVGKTGSMTLSDICGRAFIKGNPPVVFQAAMYIDGETDLEKSIALQTLFDQMKASWDGAVPKPIPVMPEEISAEDLLLDYTVRTAVPVGISYETIQTAKADLQERYCMVISGTYGSGKSRCLGKIAWMIHEKNPLDKIFIFDSERGSLVGCQAFAYRYGVCSQQEQIKEILGELAEMLNARMRAKNKARAQQPDGMDETAFIQNYEQICVFIDDLDEFIKTAGDENNDRMEKICRLAKNLGVMVFAAGRVSELRRLNQVESMTKELIQNQNGLAIGGSASMHEFFANDLNWAEKGKELPEGDAYLYNNGTCQRIKLADH